MFRSSLRSLAFAALLGGGGATWLPVSVAVAADAGSQAFLLPPGGAFPGQTVEVRVIAVDAAGQPLEGLRLTPTSNIGTVGEWREVGEGAYTFAYTVPSSGGKPTLELKGKAPDKTAFDLRASVEVMEPGADEITGIADPPTAVLGRDTSVRLEAKGAGEGGAWTRSNGGEVGKPVRKPTGELTASYTPPKVNFPQIGIVAWADAADPDRRFGFQFVPLVGSVPFPIKGKPGTNVLLRVAGREFGPVEIAADGKAKVPIEVPPGVGDAVKVVVDGDTTTESPLDLGIPATRRLVLMPVPEQVLADATAKVRVVVATPAGEPDTDATPVFTASAGTLGPLKKVRSGIFEVPWTTPSTPGKVKLGVSLEGSAVDVDELEVEVLPARPQMVTLAAQPWPLDGATASLEAMVIGGQASALRLEVEGAKAGAPKVSGTQATWSLTEVDAATFSARVRYDEPASTWPVRHVVVVPHDDQVAEGATHHVTVATLDALGRPVAQQKVALFASGAPATVTTGDDGTVEVPLTASTAGVTTLRATSQGYVGQGSWIVSATPIELPPLPPPNPETARFRALRPSLGAAPTPPAPENPWGEVAEATPEPEVTPEATPAPEPEPAPAPPPVTRPWFRGRLDGVFSSYRYEQSPSADPGEVLDQTLTVGGTAGAPASPAGLEADARAWFDPAGLPWLGAHVAFRSSWYAIGAGGFEEPARDQLLNVQVDLAGRAPFEVSGDLFWVGGRAGFRYDDFMYFTGCVGEPGCTVGFGPIGVPGLGLGPELGAEIGRLHLLAGYQLGLANASQPYSHTFDVDAGLRVVDPLFVNVGFASVSRRIELLGADTNIVRGQLSDGQMLFRVGVGVGF